MNYQLEITPLAAGQLKDACCHYDTLRNDLGDEIGEEFEATCKMILKNPDDFSYYKNPFRQAKIDRFPYVIVYEVHNNAVIVMAFFNTYQNPDKKLPGIKF